MSMDALLRILGARWWLIALLVVVSVGLTLAISMVVPRMYTATTELIVDADTEDVISGQRIPQGKGYMATQAEIIRSRKVAGGVHDRLSPEMQALAAKLAAADRGGSVDPRSWVTGMVRRNLVVDAGRSSNVLGISIQHEHPQLAAALANALADAYMETHLELRTDPARRFSVWYEDQMRVLRRNLREARQALSDYRQEHGIVALDERLDVETSRLQELSSMLVEAQGKRLQDRIREAQDGESSADVLDSPVVRDLRSELARARARLEDLSTRYGVNHPDYRTASAEVRSLRNQLAREIDVVGSSLSSTAEVSESRTRELEEALAEQKQRVLDLNSQRDNLELLRQEVVMAEDAYNAAADRASENRLESRLSDTNITVLNAAIPPVMPSSPDVRLNLVIATVLGLLLGIGVCLLLELANRRVRSVADVEEILGLPVLAHLPPGPRRRQRSEVHAS